MSYSTDCSKCIFAKSADSPIQCEFGIIESIANKKQIEIKNNYNYINEYVCKYGFSNTKLDEFKEKFNDIDIKEYIKSKNLINYYLAINNLDNKIDIKNLCEYVKKLNIAPSGMSILTKTNDMVGTIKQCDSVIGDKLLWRIHNFFDQDTTYGSALHTVMSTNTHLKKSDFIWILNDTQLDYMTNNKIIDSINFIVNVLQPSVGIMKSVTTNDLISGIFIGRQNYQRLVANVAPEIDNALKYVIETDNVHIMDYDEN